MNCKMPVCHTHAQFDEDVRVTMDIFMENIFSCAYNLLRSVLYVVLITLTTVNWPTL